MVKPVVESQGKSGRILRVDAPFDEALSALRQAGCRYPISAEQLAYARMEKGKEHSLSTNGSYTKHGFLYLKDAQPILALNSPLLDLRLARQATQANREGRYFSTQDGEMYEKFAKLAEAGKSMEPGKRKAVYLSKEDCTFTTKDADCNIVLRALFKGATEDYLKFLGHDIPLYLVDKNTVNNQKGTLLTQMWLHWLVSDYRSALYGDLRYLYYYDRVRGVSKSGEASSQKVLPYTTKDIKLAEKELGRLAKILQPEQFEKLNTLVGKLKAE